MKIKPKYKHVQLARMISQKESASKKNVVKSPPDDFLVDVTTRRVLHSTNYEV